MEVAVVCNQLFLELKQTQNEKHKASVFALISCLI